MSTTAPAAPQEASPGAPEAHQSDDSSSRVSPPINPFSEAFKAALGGKEAPKPVESQKPSEPEKQAEPPKQADPDDPPSTLKSDESKTGWMKLKEAKKAAEKAASEREAELKLIREQYEKDKKEWESTRTKFDEDRKLYDPKGLESLKRERDELSAALERAKVEEHPRFKRYYDGKIEQMVATAKRFVSPDKASKLETLLAQPHSEVRTSAFDELLADLSPSTQNIIGGIAGNIEAVRAERTSEIENARARASEFAAEQKSAEERQAALSRQQAEAQINAALAAAKDPKNGFSVFQVDKDDPQSVERAAKAEEFVRGVLLNGNTTPDVWIKMALAARQEEYQEELLKMAGDRIEQMAAQLEKLKAATPKPSPSAAASSGANETPKSWLEIVKEQIKR